MSNPTGSWAVSGNYNQVTFLYEAGEKDFFCPPLADYQPAHFESPAIAGSIADKIIRRRLIVLGGDTNSDKQSLARHFAWLVQTKIGVDAQASHTEAHMPVYEWKQSGAKFVDLALEAYPEHCIFILPSLLPQHINYDLQRLKRVTRQQHIVIVTTDDEKMWREAFDGSSDAKLLQMVWEDLANVKLYDRKQLTRTLVVKLIESKADLPDWLIQNLSARPMPQIIEGVRADRIADRLETPENIDYFVALLCYEALQGAITQATIQTCIYAVRDDTRKIQQWYNALDTTRNRLLVLALNFFDGMLDDQFFAAIENLIDREWSRRDPSLRGLDYYDFDQLGRFFDYVSTTEGRAIKTTLRNQRQKLLKVAWKGYRRHILSARPVFYDLVKQSVAQQAENWELYGSSDRRDQMRKAISETISDIGLESSAAIEDILLRMAVDPHVGIQAVAARAVARWREYNASEATFALLTRWMTDKEIEKSIRAFVPEAEKEQQDDPKTYLKGTVALVIGFAAQADRPNRMDRNLYKLLEQLSAESNELVLMNLCSCTLPMVAPLHLTQIQDIVLNLTARPTLHRAISNSMRAAYYKQPAEVGAIIEHWLNWCLNDEGDPRWNRGQRSGRPKQVGRRSLLACVAQIYGDLPYDEVASGITVATAFQHLKEILELVDNQLVRERALRSAIGLSRDHFTQLQAIVPTVTSEEMAQIVDKLTEIYLDQRAKLDGGERRWYHKGTGRYYPIWLSNRLRPLTAIENEMLEWIRNDRNVVAQQIGVRALAAFVRELDLAEARHVLSLRRAQQPRRRMEPPEVLEWRQARVGLYSRSLYHWYVIPWLVAPLSRRYRSIIRGVLPEVLRQYHTSYDIVQFLLEDWQLLIDKEFPIISRHLERAIFWDSYLGRWLLISIVLVPPLVYAATRLIQVFAPGVSQYLTGLLILLTAVWLCAGPFIWWKYARRR